MGLRDGDAVFFVAGLPKEMAAFAGLARTKVGTDLGLVAQDRFDFCWIVDFPMFEWNDEEKKIDFSHNPFSMPQGGLEALETKRAGGHSRLSIRHRLQRRRALLRRDPEPQAGDHGEGLRHRGLSQGQLEARFGGMLRALQYGAPPHGGIAPGIDRIVMLLCGEENLRQVVMFPMNQQAEDLLMGAPSEVSPKQLKELHIKLDLPKK